MWLSVGICRRLCKWSGNAKISYQEEAHCRRYAKATKSSSPKTSPLKGDSFSMKSKITTTSPSQHMIVSSHDMSLQTYLILIWRILSSCWIKEMIKNLLLRTCWQRKLIKGTSQSLTTRFIIKNINLMISFITIGLIKAKTKLIAFSIKYFPLVLT